MISPDVPLASNISPNTKVETLTEKSDLNAELKGLGDYVKEVSGNIPKELLKRQPRRLAWGILFYGGPVAIVYSFLNFDLILPLKILLSLLMGFMTAGGAFLAHETLHGAVIKNRKIQNVIGALGFAPFLISPSYWRFWHNYLHHGNTQLLYKDPDAFPTRMVWKKSKFMQWAFPLTPGSNHKRSYFYFFYWFSFQAFLNQTSMRFKSKMWQKMNHKQVTIEFSVICALAVGYLALIGPSNWILLGLIPFMIQNYTVMSYISTNHNISPYTRINDPLLNSLTVTNNPIVEFFHLNFGYHTEHHLFPKMPMSNAKVVSEKLKEMYPKRYQIMSKRKALSMLYSTPRIYKNRDTLVNPITGEEFQTISHRK